MITACICSHFWHFQAIIGYGDEGSDLLYQSFSFGKGDPNH
ncbi:hypothetical protein SAMN04487884_1226 [Butyrivibrio fibrisolvens]|uniref:Uncharacterized protein n=1 Tax=Butyrivibrio fibrisolvens TaxID=831 RepID=A0A1H9V9M4_BUTFI|nr:hypothetical protein SAMN04487884_1226 [Butyrivibrio fibrisolvens]